jgi:hypothetical protein
MGLDRFKLAVKTIQTLLGLFVARFGIGQMKPDPFEIFVKLTEVVRKLPERA